MTKFHEELRSLQFIRCSTCLERFPGLKKKSNHIECVRCHQDKHIPANNMHPGVVPPQLQVSRTEFCDVVSVIVWSNTFIPSNIYTILYSTVAFNPRNIYTILYSTVAGTVTSGGDADLSCHANDVHLPATPGTVSMDMSSTCRRMLCHLPVVYLDYPQTWMS